MIQIKNLDELDSYIMTDQPTTCPICGNRTEFIEIDKNKLIKLKL